MVFSWFQSARSGAEYAKSNNRDGSSLVELLHPLTNPSSASYWKAIANRARAFPHELQRRGSSTNESPLFLAIQRDAPPFVIQTFLQVDPSCAQEVQHIGLTPLHLVVARGSSLESTKCILEAWPKAASQKMSDGCVPLHFVRDVETARLLIDAYPEGIRVANNAFYLPLHRLVYATYASPELVQVLIQAEAELNRSGSNMHENHQIISASTWNGITPFQAACDMVERDLKSKSTASAFIVDPLKWKKLELLARAASEYYDNKHYYYQTTTNTQNEDIECQDSFCILHALVRFDSPPSVIRYAIRRYPEQLTRKDSHGRTALSIAASRRETPSDVITLLLEDCLRYRAPCHDGNKRQDHRECKHIKSREACPENYAMICDATCGGRLPLHVSIASGRIYDEGMEAIWKAGPAALLIQDPVTHLYPPMLAAASKPKHEPTPCKRLRTIYSLLREAPWLIPTTVDSTACKNDSYDTSRNFLVLSRLNQPPWNSPTLLKVLLPVMAAILARAFISAVRWDD